MLFKFVEVEGLNSGLVVNSYQILIVGMIFQNSSERLHSEIHN